MSRTTPNVGWVDRVDQLWLLALLSVFLIVVVGGLLEPASTVVVATATTGLGSITLGLVGYVGGVRYVQSSQRDDGTVVSVPSSLTGNLRLLQAVAAVVYVAALAALAFVVASSNQGLVTTLGILAPLAAAPVTWLVGVRHALASAGY